MNSEVKVLIALLNGTESRYLQHSDPIRLQKAIRDHNLRAFNWNIDSCRPQAALKPFKNVKTGETIPLEEVGRDQVRAGHFPATVAQAHAMERDAVVWLRKALGLKVDAAAKEVDERFEKRDLLEYIGVDM